MNPVLSSRNYSKIWFCIITNILPPKFPQEILRWFQNSYGNSSKTFFFESLPKFLLIIFQEFLPKFPRMSFWHSFKQFLQVLVRSSTDFEYFSEILKSVFIRLWNFFIISYCFSSKSSLCKNSGCSFRELFLASIHKHFLKIL